MRDRLRAELLALCFVVVVVAIAAAASTTVVLFARVLARLVMSFDIDRAFGL
jgi:hypothetical protein